MNFRPPENLTPRAQQSLELARKEADRFHHNYIGTEHLLLGILALGHGGAISTLQSMGLDMESIRAEVERQVGHGPEVKIVNNAPFTPRTKKVLNQAAKEARQCRLAHVGTEHVLLALLVEGEGVAARVLFRLEVDVEKTRRAVEGSLS